LQRGIAIFDCEAAALPGRFLPELGRSHERPFFLPDLLGRGGVASSLVGLSPRRSSRLAPKSLGKNLRNCFLRSALLRR
jgi:hypothetical protein